MDAGGGGRRGGDQVGGCQWAGKGSWLDRWWVLGLGEGVLLRRGGPAGAACIWCGEILVDGDTEVIEWLLLYSLLILATGLIQDPWFRKPGTETHIKLNSQVA